MSGECHVAFGEYGEIHFAVLVLEQETAQFLMVAIDTGAVYTNINGANFKKTLKEMLPDIKLSYTQATAISLTNIGVVNYKNAGNVLGSKFQIRVPFIVEYKWGYVVVPMDITIDPTIGQ